MEQITTSESYRMFLSRQQNLSLFYHNNYNRSVRAYQNMCIYEKMLQDNAIANCQLHHAMSRISNALSNRVLAQEILNATNAKVKSTENKTFNIKYPMVSYREVDSNSIQMIFNSQMSALIKDHLSLSCGAKAHILEITKFIENVLTNYQPFVEHHLNMNKMGDGVEMFDSDLHLGLNMSELKYQKHKDEKNIQLAHICDLKKVKSLIKRALKLSEEDKQTYDAAVKIGVMFSQGVMTPMLQIDMKYLINFEPKPDLSLTERKSRKLIVSINHWTRLVQNSLIRFLSILDNRFRELTMIFLFWLKQNGFLEEEDLKTYRFMTKYSFTLMVVYFLQVIEHPILPPIIRIQSAGRALGFKKITIDKHPFQLDCFDYYDLGKMKSMIGFPNKNNSKSTLDLLAGLFKFYAFELDIHNYIICPQTGESELKSGKNGLISIQDPILTEWIMNNEKNNFSVELLKEKMKEFLDNLTKDSKMNKTQTTIPNELQSENVLIKELQILDLNNLADKSDNEPIRSCPNVHHFDIYTDGSKLITLTNTGRTGCAFVVYSQGKIHHWGLYRLSNNCTVLQAELLAIRNAVSWCVQEKKSATIHSDSVCALGAIKAQSSYLYDLASDIQLLLSNNQQSHFCLRWVKAHAGIEGNEMADKLAKQATNFDTISYECPPNVSAVSSLSSINNSSFSTTEDEISQNSNSAQ